MRIRIVACLAALLINPAAWAGAETDVPEIINRMIPFAEEFLLDYGEFFPFGGAMKSDGEIVTVSGTEGMGAQPASQDVIDTVTYNLQIGASNNGYKATAIVYKVMVVPPGKTERTDAVAMEVEHIEGYTAIMVFPYTLKDNKVSFGDVFAKGGKARIFKRSAENSK